MSAPEDRLVVWLGAHPVGDLRRGRRGEIRFVRRPGSAALTVAADGAAEAWTPVFTRAWFDGLLPEGERRTAAEGEHGVVRGDIFGLLAAIGWECAGAVSVLPDGREPAAGTYLALTDMDLAERLDALPRPVAAIDHEVRLSLGGAQDKLLLAHLDGRWQLPLLGAISTHILKPEPDRFPGIAAGETWALAVASAATRTAAATLLEPSDQRPTIVVERYDRLVVGGTEAHVERIHQEDGCQVLGLPPEQKYARGAGPREASLRRMAALLVERAADPVVELRRLLEQVVVTVALLNTDAHAKNISLLHTGPRTVSLSPLYDVVPTVWFLPVQAKLALPIGGKWRIDEIERRHVVAEATSWGVPEGEARRVIGETLGAVAGGIVDADRRFAGAPAGMRDAVGAQVARLTAGAW